MIDENNVVKADIINGASVASIKNTFNSFSDNWYQNGVATTLYGPNACFKQVPIHSAFTYDAAELDNGELWWTYIPSDWSTNALKNSVPAADYDDKHKSNIQRPFQLLVFFMDAEHSVSIIKRNHTSYTEPIAAASSSNYKMPDAIANAYKQTTDDATSLTNLNLPTYTNIVRVYTRDIATGNHNCSDEKKYYRRLISHEAGHFFTSSSHSADAKNLMYSLTRCGANTILPALSRTSTTTKMINEFSEIPSAGGTQRWIP